MSSLNKVMLIGNVGKDPELRRAANGDQVASLSLATSETWRDKATGERKERTEWHRVVCFDTQLCTVIEQYVKKGSKLYIEGELRTRKWQDQTGQDRFTTEVVMPRFGATLKLIGDPKARASEDDYGTTRTREPAAKPQQSAKPGYGDLDDDIPF